MKITKISGIILLIVFTISILAISTLASELVGTFEEFEVDSDFSDSVYTVGIGPRNVYLYTYPIENEREWYSLYVLSTDINEQTCMIGLALKGGALEDTVTIKLDEVYEFMKDTESVQYIGVSGITGGGSCKVAYEFNSLNFNTDMLNGSNEEIVSNGPEDSTETLEDEQVETSEEEDDIDEDENNEDSLPQITTIEESPIELCSDTDGGYAPYSGGEMTHSFPHLPTPIVDTCANQNTLFEYYCNSDIYPDEEPANVHEVDCPYGCVMENDIGHCMTETEADEQPATIEAVFNWVGEFFADMFRDSEPEWNIVSNAELSNAILRGFDAGEFQTDLVCPEGSLVSTISIDTVRTPMLIGKPQMLGIRIYCGSPDDEGLLGDTTSIIEYSMPSWPATFPSYGFSTQANYIVQGLQAYPTTVGNEYLKRLLAYRRVLMDDGDKLAIEPIYIEVPEDKSVTTTTTVEADCPGDSALSGLRVYTLEEDYIISGLQLWCSEIGFS